MSVGGSSNRNPTNLFYLDTKQVIFDSILSDYYKFISYLVNQRICRETSEAMACIVLFMYTY